MVDVEAAWGPKTAPNFTDSATPPTQALDPRAKPRLRGTKWQRNGQVQKNVSWQAVSPPVW